MSRWTHWLDIMSTRIDSCMGKSFHESLATPRCAPWGCGWCRNRGDRKVEAIRSLGIGRLFRAPLVPRIINTFSISSLIPCSSGSRQSQCCCGVRRSGCQFRAMLRCHAPATWSTPDEFCLCFQVLRQLPSVSRYEQCQ